MLLDKIFSGKTVLALCGTVFLFYFIYRILLLFYPHPDIGGVEGNVIYFIQRLLDGSPFYTDPAKAPYAIAQYSPLYYYIVAGAARLAGVQADEVYSVFLTGRIISLLLNLGMVLVVYKLCRNVFAVLARRSLVTGMTAFIFLAITSFGRPDSLYHLFFLLSLYYFLKAEKKGSNSTSCIVAAACFAVLTLFSKQTGIILPVFTGTWLVWNKKFRLFFLYTSCYLALTAVMLIVISQSLGWDLFFSNAVQGINNGISVGWYWYNILEPLYWGTGIFLLLAFLLLLRIFKEKQDKLLQLAGFILVSLFVLMNLIALKLGSVPGYFTEWWTFLFILLAVYWPVITKAFGVINKYIPAGLAIVLLMMKLFVLITPLKEKINAISSAHLMDSYRREEAVAAKIVQQLNPGDQYVVFTNLYTPESYLSNFLFRHAVVPQMEIVALAAYPQKKYDYTDLQKRLQDGSIGWMLKKEKETAKRFYDIPLDKYVLTDSINNFYLYRYKH